MVREVKILVKSTNSKFTEQIVNCPGDWLISDFKRHLSNVLNIEFSSLDKLIFSGKLLPDDEIVGKAFEQTLDEDFHVVYFATSSGSLLMPPHKPDQNQDGTLRRRHLSDHTSCPDSLPKSCSHNTNIHLGSAFQSPLPTISPDLSAGLQSTFIWPTAFLAQQNAYPVGPSMLNETVDYASLQWISSNLGQIMWMQSAYAEYINQYIHYLRDVRTQHAAPAGAMLVEEVSPQNGNIQQEALPEQRPAQVMNAQGGAFLLDDEEDGRIKDWLDWAYVVMRFVMLMCILYFYSTPTRFVTFIVASILFFIYQAGWLTFPSFRRQNDIQPQEQGGERAEDADGNGERDDAEINRNFPRFVSTLWSIIVGFFVSLAPQAPPPINVN